ncbi:MAG: NrfD/PsrC family molybdoenzyme membrane anchor subunit [Candidatus Hodarchaeales archaeon]|jgi:molybdopterin-containing oxidoreductase family membrane subunit
MYDRKDSVEDIILKPLNSFSKKYFIILISLIVIIAGGAFAWLYQLQEGLGVTGLSNRVFWGVYIGNFIFFIGISYSGTLISAVLRLTQAGWRKPLTRMSEVITVVGIIVGFSMIFIDLGRPDRILLVPFAGRLQSPLFWDFISVATYLVGSIIFLYLPLIPDIAFLRDKYKNNPLETENRIKKIWFFLRGIIYKVLAMGWKGNKSQKRKLERNISIMTIILVPIAISAHTVIAFIFAMTWRVGWHSTIFGPYFVIGAIFSGIAAIIIAVGLLRKIYHFESLITYKEFRNLGFLLFVFFLMYSYFTVTEYFTSLYRGATEDIELVEALLLGNYAVHFWVFVIFGLIIPGIMILIASIKYESEKAIWVMMIASALVVGGMWLKRFIIVVPSLARPFVFQEWTIYTPTWVEWAITIAAAAGFVLFYSVFAKLFPLISLWELEEENLEPE